MKGGICRQKREPWISQRGALKLVLFSGCRALSSFSAIGDINFSILLIYMYVCIYNC